ncbi:VTT domain-containing protein [Noviherbaspirillum pedocola]|uniref:VTT domain-containing protein n=1 Tax=Noviherbaspirillum pedocola TaxID=2801341 RepID=A0A934W5Q0_9BURK|nr:VTT domain-containing protein [Noviherbaspirillum pedocola]MBK4734185.1 VTT domain-containing protein [Noviherbaspirillum pedocola]
MHTDSRFTQPSHQEAGLLQPGRNCWRIERARRFSLLIDADAYFRALRAAIRAARRSVYILGWDIDSRIRLVPGGAQDGYPEPLADFLHAVVRDRPELRIHVLNWDFAMLYALERELLPSYQPGWRRHRRLAFCMDGRHPVGASHHQKIVVVDDRLAFVGGLDLTRSRWDTPEHAPQQPLRRDPDGKPYAPFHDVQAMVDGDVAATLGALARERWRRATGKPAREPRADRQARRQKAASAQPVDPWPAHIEPDLTDVDVAISRTAPAYDGESGIYEVRQLYLDAIDAARETLFFENQYFTSDALCNALSARLARPDAPETLVVSPHSQSGWLEQETMGALRARIHQRLRNADHGARYRMVCPHLPGLSEGCLNVHSKVFSVDDRLFSVGSANMSNRSMAYDTECNLSIEARGERSEDLRGAIARMRNRLLAEHLDVTPEQVAASMTACGSLHRTLDALRRERTLAPLEPAFTPEMESMMLDSAVFDPEQPIKPDELIAQMVPEDAHKPVPRRLVGLGGLAIALALLAVVWRFTPLREWVNLASLITFARSLQDMPFTPLAAIGCYALAGVLMVPVTLLIAVTGIVFGPFEGAAYAVCGSMLSAFLTYWIGRWCGRDALRGLLGARINRLSHRLAQRGILAMVVIRILPVAPFSVINVVAGAFHIRLRDYLVGTLLGMTPGIVLTVTFVHNLAEAIRHPSFGTVLMLSLVAVLLIASAVGLQRLFGMRERAWKS